MYDERDLSWHFDPITNGHLDIIERSAVIFSSCFSGGGK